MDRIVCDVGVIISGLLSSRGAPATLLDLWLDARFDIVASPLWLAELDRVVVRPRIASYIDSADAAELREAIGRQAVIVADPPPQPGLTPDPGDDYLVSLARVSTARCIVSGDRHLLELVDPLPPVMTPRAFVDTLPPARPR